MAGWSVVVTRPHHEARACEHLARQAYDFYLPKIKVAKRVVPLFPRYVFVGIGERWYSLLGTFGISCVLFSSGRPAVVANKIVDELRGMEDKSGLVVLPAKQDPTRLQIGQPVRITGGCFAGLTGLYQGASARQRERVLLECLGSVELAVGSLVAL
jgi:transcription antitermination factor NusG